MGVKGALAHVCRTVCRRAERHIYRLVSEGGYVEDVVLKFINRLSDYFFTLARKEGFESGTRRSGINLSNNPPYSYIFCTQVGVTDLSPAPAYVLCAKQRQIESITKNKNIDMKKII